MMHMRSAAPAAGLALLLSACGGPAAAPAPPTPDPSPAQTFPTTAPEPLPVEDVRFPEYAEHTLQNGARLLVVENHEQPVVSIQLLLPGAGSAADPEEMAGLASLTASQLDKGTRTMTSAEIAEAVDFLGANLSASASSDWSAVSLTSITDFLDEGLGIMSDVVLNPTFPAEELESQKRRRISELRLARSQPGALAAEAFGEAVYGDHPYGQQATAETIEVIDAADVERFHQQRYRPGDALFVVAGDVDPDDIARKLDLAFAGWEGRAPAVGVSETPAGQTGREMVFVQKPGSVQAVVRLGHLFPDATGADWVTLDVANQVLGSPSAAFTAWMMSVLREERGYTYGAYSQMSERLGPGTFVMQGEFRNEVADSALAIMLELADRIRTGDIPAEDLEEARSYLTGAFPREIETPQQVAGQVARNRLLGRPDSYLEEYRSRVAGVEAAEIARVTSQLIHPEDLVMVVVGDATEVLDRVRPFADRVRVVDTEGEPLDMGALIAAAEASANLTFDASALEPRTMVYALRLGANELGTVTTRWQRDGETFVSVSELPGGITQSTTFDARSFAPRSLVFRAGAMGEFGLTVEEGRATGQGINMQTGQPEEIDVPVPPGTALDGMLEVAMAVNSFEDVGEFTLRVLTGTGEVQGTSVRTVGTETVEVPAGTFDTYKLEVSGQQPMTVWVTRSEPHIVVKREAAGPGGQTIEIVLREME